MSTQKKAKVEQIHIEEAARLKALYETQRPEKMSQEKFGATYEIGSQGVVWQYLNARIPLNLEAALKFAKGLSCSVGQFSPRLAKDLGERDVSHAPAEKIADISLSEDADPAARHAESMRSYGLHPIAVWDHPDELPEGDFIQVPRLNVHLSAGNGHGEQLEIDLERANPQVFRAEWARRERLKPGALASMYAKGNSMEPRICDGDSLLVDTSQIDVLDGRVYAVWYSGELRVKRLYKRVDGGLIVHSDNERDYPKLDVPPDQLEHIRIIGRVVHVQGTGGL
ncbi:hypothetical protein GPA19_05240 [Azoarcus indigens]|uniref:Peptidase S24-like protein n=1 Tax=Azoarcus indigens TaxID=29545 RepID=A0A4R6DX28_9RHOO|nr:S24 family peptidase [Azoarcus indigens]NMG64349.1 hypothetical protein [Azoarcus indigens]TDN49199.1 peptidase S24-like protein [Azoarcus indigens]